jgi:ABC-2 type transport system ATP-binding protein
MTPAIDTAALTIERGGRTVLRDLSLSVVPGEVFALLGGNGAGKSTTLMALLGFLPPVRGQAMINGLSVTDNVREVRRFITYLPESATLYGHLSGVENLRYFLGLAGLDADPAAIDTALAQVSLQREAYHQPMARYSKGMRQKVAIALALLRDTPILLLDEPTSGLDPVAIDEFNRLVRTLAGEGRTVLLVTHDVYGACQVADRIGMLREGELMDVFEAPEGRAIDTEAVHAAFTAGSVTSL